MQIEGIVESIIFRNEDNGYTVARFSAEDEEFTIVGNAMMLHEKEQLRLEGDWVFHPKYGEQFKFYNLEIIRPQEKSGIIGYLSSGLIPHIGEITAKRIVDRFGEDTLDILENHPERLHEIKGLGTKRIADIKSVIGEQKEIRELMLYTQKLGIGTNLSLKIYKKYGEIAQDVIQSNPYQLADDIRGIGFRRADSIARMLGFKADSDFRKLSAMKYILGESVGEGHSYLPVQELIQRSSYLLELPEDELESVLVELSIDPNIYLTGFESDDKCYFTSFYKAETNVSGKLIQKSQLKIPEGMYEDLLEKMEDKLSYPLVEAQKKAVKASLEQGVLVITGGPGTGKTTTLNAIVYVLESLGLKVTLTAPTGRAAKRMEEATSRPAQTIHRLLQFDYIPDDDIGIYSREIEEELDSDVVIVDEASMVDLLLLNDLLEGMRPDARLIMVGDVDQLPSVGAGNVLRDIIASGKIEVVELNTVFRQAKTSMIVQNAHKINHGEYPVLNKQDKDFYLVRTRNPQEAQKTIAELVSRRLPNHYGIDPMEDIQVLSPMKKGPCGVEALNKLLQKVLNPKKQQDEMEYGDYLYRVNDKVMQIKNDYELEWTSDSIIYSSKGKGIFNGDMGRIKDIDLEEDRLSVVYDECRIVNYDTSNLDLIMPAYACTIHKSQGSEFPVVVIPVVGGPPMLLTRNLIYTGITRAKKLVVLVGQRQILNRMVDNDRIDLRYSGLDERLQTLGDQLL